MLCVEFGVSIETYRMKNKKKIIKREIVNILIANLMGVDIDFNPDQTKEFGQSVKG